MRRLRNYIPRSRRPGPIFISAVTAISAFLTLIYLNKDYSGFDGFAHLSSSFFQTNYHKSCLSRQESSSYRRPTPHKPSPYLLTKLLHYESLHRRCGPNTRPYRRTINTLIKSGDRIYIPNKNDDDTTECRYIVWRAAQGLGNQMVSMVSAFLYALLTNRVLLINSGAHLTSLFCEPFHNVDLDHIHITPPSWILPNDFPYRKNHFRHLKTFQTLMKDVIMHSNTSFTATGIKLPPFLYVNLYSGSFDRVKYFHCDQAHTLLNKIPVLVTQSDLYYAPSLFMTPSFTEELNRMFPDKTTVFHHLGRYLFHPSDVAWRRITQYYDAHLSKADIKLGLQIRVVHTNQVSQQEVMDQILSCTINRGVLPPPPPSLPSNEENRTNLTTAPQGSSSIAVMIASLFPYYANNLTTMYGQIPTPKGELIKIYQPTSEGHQKFDNAQQNMNAWVEMYLLSLCDKLVTTGESTFGYVAEGLAGLKPWVLRKQDKDTSKSVSCWRAPTIDPCFQFPPKYDCVARRGVELDQMSRLFPNTIKICEDRGLGIRLSHGGE